MNGRSASRQLGETAVPRVDAQLAAVVLGDGAHLVRVRVRAKARVRVRVRVRVRTRVRARVRVRRRVRVRTTVGKSSAVWM